MSLETPIAIRTLQRKLYRKAKQEPDFRFYLLYDKIYREDVLRHAYELAKANKGAPGVDGQTFEAIETEGLEKWMEGIRKDLRDKTYKPQPVRRVLIPKPGGGERPLGIPTIRDRTVQTAAKLVLEPIFEADLEPEAYGYRPKRSAHDAIQKVHKLLVEGYTDVVDADLSKYFDTIPHTELLKSVARRIVDRNVLHLIKMWLQAPVEERDENGKRHMTGGRSHRCGTPQGGIVTPLTQKVISSSKGQSRAGEQGTRCLTSVLRGNMCMTYDALNQSGKGSAAERRSWPTPASCCFTRSSPAVVTRVRSVRASSISVLGGSVPARSTRRSHRAYSADHVEASAEHGGTAAEVREKQWPDHRSDCDRRVERVSRCSKEAWLSRAQKAAHCKFTFPIRLIACSSQSSRKPTTFWCPLGSAPSAGV